jgi:hypothetical protein
MIQKIPVFTSHGPPWLQKGWQFAKIIRETPITAVNINGVEYMDTEHQDVMWGV